MAEFLDPHRNMTADRKYTTSELIRALRQDLAAEEEAASLYETHAEMTDHPLARKILKDIADEERVHIGEFQRLLNVLSSDEEELLQKGEEEVDAEAGANTPTRLLPAPEIIALEMD